MPQILHSGLLIFCASCPWGGQNLLSFPGLPGLPNWEQKLYHWLVSLSLLDKRFTSPVINWLKYFSWLSLHYLERVQVSGNTSTGQLLSHSSMNCWSEMPEILISFIQADLCIHHVKICVMFSHSLLQSPLSCTAVFLNGLRFRNRMIVDTFIAPSELVGKKKKKTSK